MSKIVIGKAGHTNITLDLSTLLSTRMLLTADSGGGKTFAMKRICEQAFGKIQIIIVDPEGEFSPLREKFDFVLAGKGGETPADTRSAALLALRLLETRASCICDIFEMKPSQRHEWVKLFIDGLIEAPKATRHPVLVIVDEAHIFCPEKGKGESQASEAMISLCTRGRKRFLCPLFATQRLATLNKDASSMLLNRMIGPTFEDLNRKRAAEVLSISREDTHEFMKEIQLLEPGNFFVLGRALTRERTLMRVGPIKTPHGQEAMKYDLTPPPAPEKVKALLPKLADLPKEAEEKAKTVAELRNEIRALKSELRTQPKQTPVQVPVFDTKQIERATRDIKGQADKRIATVHANMKRLYANGNRLAKALQELATSAIKQFDMIHLSEIGTWPTEPPVSTPKSGGFIHSTRPTHPPPILNVPVIHAPEPTNSDLKGPHKAILKALGELLSIGKDQPPKPMVAAWAGYSPGGGAFMNPLGALRSWGLVDYPTAGFVALTASGRDQVGPCEPPDQEEIHRRVRDILLGPEKKILNVFLSLEPGAELSKPDLAERSGYEVKGGAFQNPLGALRTAGFVDYPRSGYVRAADWLFLE